MSKKHGGKLPAFVPLLRSMLKSPAWKALSPGARAAFVALKANYTTNMQNAVNLSARSGAKELGVHTHTALKFLRELEHYGFIVNVEKGSLGVFGYARAPKFRLTDWYYAGQPPTLIIKIGMAFYSSLKNRIPCGLVAHPMLRNRT